MKQLTMYDKYTIDNTNFYFKITFIFDEKIRKARPKISKETKLLLKNISNSDSKNMYTALNKYYKNFNGLYSFNIQTFIKNNCQINLTFNLDSNV